jgi:ribosome maturation factor RimP
LEFEEKNRLERIARSAAESNGLEFVHLETAGSKRTPVFRVFIDKTEGVSIEDCADVSRAMEAVLDAEDFIPYRYTLEVSSPGIERELYSLADFERFVGRLAKLKTTEEIDGRVIHIGMILGVNDSNIRFEELGGGAMEIPFEKVLKANLKMDLKEELNSR